VGQSLRRQQSYLVSTDTSFTLEDDLQDVWGEMSAGGNFPPPKPLSSPNVTFGEEIDAVGGKAGMRVAR
jgi:autotransporter family porin